MSNAIFVLTSRGIRDTFFDGGSKAWVLNADRARQCKYVVCIQNVLNNDCDHPSAPHHAAFLVGKLKEVIPHPVQIGAKRWVLLFSEYAEIEIPNAWPGNQNPVFYGDIDHFGIDINNLKFKPMPEPEPEPEQLMAPKKVSPLTMNEAKAGLAITFAVDPSDIQIIIRG